MNSLPSKLLFIGTCLVFTTMTFANENVLTEAQQEEEAARYEESEFFDEKTSGSLEKSPIKKGFRTRVFCNLDGPAQVKGYRVQCNDASYVDFAIADCCISGDHWQLKGKNWDSRPNTAVTTSPGKAGLFGVPARVYNYGGTTDNPGNMDTYLECSMLHGVDVFGAGSSINITSNASSCTVTADNGRVEINRAP